MSDARDLAGQLDQAADQAALALPPLTEEEQQQMMRQMPSRMGRGPSAVDRGPWTVTVSVTVAVTVGRELDTPPPG